MDEPQLLENYNFIKTIGEGTFGKVKLAIHKPTNEEVAIKILEKSKIKKQKELERIEKEIKYMKMLNHPNIVKIYEIIEDNNNFYISMEYVPGGELFTYIVKNKHLDEKEASFFYAQIIHIIQEIHKHRICHRDLKPENLLLTNNKTLKIIDFGLSNEYNDYLETPCGSPCYASPEIIKGQKYSGLSIDLWASGVILFSMLFGYLPFDDKDDDVLFRKIIDCKLEFPKKNNINISDNAKDLIKKILKKEPSQRISLDKILEHPFLNYGNKKYKEKIKMDINKQDKLIIDYMINIMNISNDNDIITRNIKNNKHNNLTTTFNLLKKKYNEGRLNYNILQNNEIDNNKSKIIKKIQLRRLNKSLINGSNYNNNSLVQDLGNIIKRKVNENNNIIIINNNNNLVNQSNKMKYILNSFFKENKNEDNKNRSLLKKIDTSISVEKPKKDKNSINISQSSKIEDYNYNDNYNDYGYNSKVREKDIFYKKYIDTTPIIKRNNFLNKRNNILKTDSYNLNTGNSSNDKNNNYFEYKKKIIPSSHLKTLTNLQHYTSKNNDKDREEQYSIKIRLKNDTLINPSLYSKKTEKKKLFPLYYKNNEYNEFNLLKRIPHSKRIYTKRIHFSNNLTNNSLNKTNYDQLNKIKNDTNNSLVQEIKTNLNNDNDFNNYLKKSLNNTEEGTYFSSNTVNYDNDNNKNSFKYNKKHKLTGKIIKDKKNYYKKLNILKLRDNKQKLEIDKLLGMKEKQINSTNLDINNSLSEREKYPNKIYFNKTITHNNLINIDIRRRKLQTKELTEQKFLNNSIAYSKKICPQNKTSSKINNNYLILSTNLNLYQISNRISKYCVQNGLFYEHTKMKYEIIIKKTNTFIIEIKLSEGSHILKFSHENGDESQTRDHMTKLFYKIAI